MPEESEDQTSVSQDEPSRRSPVVESLGKLKVALDEAEEFEVPDVDTKKKKIDECGEISEKK